MHGWKDECMHASINTGQISCTPINNFEHFAIMEVSWVAEPDIMQNLQVPKQNLIKNSIVDIHPCKFT